MLTKRRVIVGTVVFIFAGLLLFTFANPSQVNEGNENNNVTEQEKEEKNDKKEQIKEEKKEENVVVNNNTNTNNTTTSTANRNNYSSNNDNTVSLRAGKIATLMTLITKNKDDYTTDSFAGYEKLVSEIVKDGKLEVSDLTDEQLDKYITDIKEAINNLVDLELVSLTISSNNDVYKRLEAQKELTFEAIYNDELRNKNVLATTTDLFDTSVVAEVKTMVYSYSDKYGKVSAEYIYSVVKNDRDLLLDKLEEVKNKEINEEDYTKESVDNLNDVKNTDPTDLTNEEIEELIEKIEEAYEDLVELKLIGLEVSSNNDVYKRLEEQKKLTFEAIYNDETRNKNVKATTNDEFNSSMVTEVDSIMTYSYSDKYGKASVEYIYSVVKNDRDLLLDKLNELLNKEIDEEIYTTPSVEDLKEALDVDPEKLTDEEVEEAIEKIEEAYENLVKVQLEKLEVSSNNDVYARGEKQKELTFTAVYNDELKNRTVKATTEDVFSTEKTSTLSTMTYSFTEDKYVSATKTVDYKYSVVKNEKDKLLDELLKTEIDEEIYTTPSVEDLKEALDVDPTDLTIEEVEEAIEKIKEAIENLVKVQLEKLEVSSNNDVYARGEKQKTLTFIAVYNDELKNRKVKATTEDVFSTEKLSTSSTMTYSFTEDKYVSATKTVDYKYSVVKNEKDKLLDELLKTEVDKDLYTTDSYNDLQEALDVDPTDLTIEEVEEAIEKIQKAIENLVELKLEKLEVTPNVNEYKRGENQKTLTFKAIYNDENRTGNVTNVKTNDKFDTTTITAENEVREMTYTYTDSKNRTASAKYSYTVVKNNRDLLLDKLNELLINKLDKDLYTTDSYNNYENTLKVIPEKLTDEQLEEAIEKIEEAIEKLVELKLERLEVTPNNDTYERGTGKQKTLTFKAVYNDKYRTGNVTDVKTNDKFDTTTNGSKSMTYTYTDKKNRTASVKYNYTVVRNNEDKKIVGITAKLSKTEFGYLTNEDVKGYLTVETVAKDGKKEATTNYKVEGFSTKTLGENELKVIYNPDKKLTTTLEYVIVRTEEGQVLKSLEVKLNSKEYGWKTTSYTSTVTATDNDGTKYDVTTSATIVKGLDTNSLGEKEYKVSYTKNGVTKEATTKYTVVRTEAGKKLDHITVSLSDSTFKRETKESEAKKRLTVTAYDLDGTSYKVTDYTTNFDASEIGNKELIVTYVKENVTKEAKVNYTVVKNDEDLKIKKVDVSLSKTNYAIDEEIEGLEVEVTYGYGNKEKLTTCSNDFNSKSAGHKTLTVNCDGTKGTTSYSVYNNNLKALSAKLNRSDAKYITNSPISVEVKYTDEYNVTKVVDKNDYSIDKELSTKTSGKFTSKITYKGLEATVSYTVSEEYLFDVSVVNSKYVKIIESYMDFIDITKVVVTYTDNDKTTYKANPGLFENGISMVDYKEEKTDDKGRKYYTYPEYHTDSFATSWFQYKTPTKIEIYYGRAKDMDSKYHSYKLTYTVKDGKVVFNKFEDLKKEYNN